MLESENFYYKSWRKLMQTAFGKEGIDWDTLADFRVTIIEVHCMIESHIDKVIDKFIYGESPKSDIRDIKTTLSELGMIDMSFGYKIQILGKIKKEQPFSLNFKYLNYIKDLRNYVAHNFIIGGDTKELYYKGKHLLRDGAINNVVKDCGLALQELSEAEAKTEKATYASASKPVKELVRRQIRDKTK